MMESYQSFVLFLRSGNRLYYEYNGSLKILNDNSISNLKSTLKCPFLVEFLGLSSEQIGKIIMDLHNDDYSVTTKNIETLPDGSLHFVSYFSNVKEDIRDINNTSINDEEKKPVKVKVKCRLKNCKFARY